VSTALSLRQDLALAIADALPAWAVYTAPPEQVRGACVVIAPRSPYRRRSDYCAQEVLLRITLLMPRAAGPIGLDALDTTCDTVAAAIDSLGDVTWETVDDMGMTVEVGSAEYITAAFNVVGFVR
jgi:hypothetical protein